MNYTRLGEVDNFRGYMLAQVQTLKGPGDEFWGSKVTMYLARGKHDCTVKHESNGSCSVERILWDVVYFLIESTRYYEHTTPPILRNCGVMWAPVSIVTNGYYVGADGIRLYFSQAFDPNPQLLSVFWDTSFMPIYLVATNNKALLDFGILCYQHCVEML